MAIYIESLETSSGFLKDAPVGFDRGLTCIIGARGTCKSTIVETIRFAFDCDPARVQELVNSEQDSDINNGPSHRGLVYATLKSGIAKCEVCKREDKDTDAFTIEREVEGKSRIFREGIQELTDQDVLHSVEIYSQGDLQHIAQNESRRLDLIDRPNKSEIARLSTQRTDFANQLKTIGPQIRGKAIEIETRTADVRALEGLRQQLAQLQAGRPILPQELDRQRAEFIKRKAIVEAAAAALNERAAFRTDLEAISTRACNLPVPPPELVEIAPDASDVILSEFQQMTEFVKQLQAEVARDVDERLNAQFAIVKNEFDRKNSRYFELRQEQQGVNEALKREDAVKQQITHLERIKAELDKFTEELRELKEKRSKLRAAIRQISDQIFTLRQREVDVINQNHSDTVVLSIEQGIRTEDYSRKLIELLQGSRIRLQEDVARDVAAKIQPCDLVDIVERSDADRLALLLERDQGQMTRLLAFLADSADFYEIESVEFHDRLEITMYDQNVPKPLSQLSKGQMATALLPLILRPASYPLIFDQPEDDLDNSFIYETLVRHIRLLKETRQLIFVTHNANIPVLGDADKVIVMEMENPQSAKGPISGSVECVKDKILGLLEGGAEAFRRRREKYGALLSETDGAKDANRIHNLA